jgi:hypothetical protein
MVRSGLLVPRVTLGAVTFDEHLAPCIEAATLAGEVRALELPALGAAVQLGRTDLAQEIRGTAAATLAASNSILWKRHTSTAN